MKIEWLNEYKEDLRGGFWCSWVVTLCRSGRQEAWWKVRSRLRPACLRRKLQTPSHVQQQNKLCYLASLFFFAARKKEIGKPDRRLAILKSCDLQSSVSYTLDRIILDKCGEISSLLWISLSQLRSAILMAVFIYLYCLTFVSSLQGKTTLKLDTAVKKGNLLPTP